MRTPGDLPLHMTVTGSEMVAFTPEQLHAIEARDGDAAVAEMEQHLERLNRHYLSLLRQKDRAEAAHE